MYIWHTLFMGTNAHQRKERKTIDFKKKRHINKKSNRNTVCCKLRNTVNLLKSILLPMIAQRHNALASDQEGF